MSNGALRRFSQPAEGSCFVVDTDAFVQPGDIPAFEAAAVMVAIDELHEPVSQLFESLVKDDLRKLFQEGAKS
jgi:uncharacterized protein (TIGR04255 family)